MPLTASAAPATRSPLNSRYSAYMSRASSKSSISRTSGRGSVIEMLGTERCNCSAFPCKRRAVAGVGRLKPMSRRSASAAGVAAALVFVGVTAVTLLAMGRAPICKCGYVKLWHGVVMSSENSQHISDWYTPSHLIHGFIFYGLLWLVGRRWPLGLRLCLAILVEGSWEIFENTDFIINRYREATISLDYYGDSVLNSTCDILAMVVGFFIAAKAPVWLTVAL